MLVPILYDTLLVASCLAAMRWGEGAERAGAAIMLAGTLFTFVTAGTANLLYSGLNLRLVLIDAAAFAAFLVVMCRSRKFWPIWASALQSLSVFASLAPLLQGRVERLAFAVNEEIWAWPILVLILVMPVVRVRTAKRSMATLPPA